MLQSLTLLLALHGLGAQETALEITNVRSTYGYLGATHPPAAAGRLPGDIVYFAFDIKNMKLDKAGRASYTLLVEIKDDKGDLVYKLGPTNAVAQNYLGGNSMPCSAHMEVPLDAMPGAVHFKVTITDRVSKQSVSLERKGKIHAPGFGLVRVATYADREGKVPAAPIGVIGESIYIGFAPVGFARDKSTGQPDLHVTLRVLDDKGQPTLSQPLSGEVNKNVPDGLKILQMQFGITLNRVGTFLVELQATDKITGKISKVKLPLRVLTFN